MRALAWVRSTRHEALDDGWDAETSAIELDDAVPDEALEGLAGFSHVDVLFVFHLARDVPPAPWARHPRENLDWPRVGIFAQRARERPNRLGATTCRIVSTGPRRIEVAGLDAIDGTPVVDIKAHVAQFGARGAVRQPPWVDELMAGYFEADHP